MEETLIKSQSIYKGRAVNLRVDTIRKEGSQETTREIVEHPDCIAVVALDEKKNVLLERQFRRAVGKYLLEIPAGGIDPGETPEESVRRELQEETGFYPQKVQRLGGFYSAPGYSTEYLYLFLATDLKPGRLHAEDTDEIELVRVPVNKVLDLIARGEICDSKSIAGLLQYICVYSRE